MSVNINKTLGETKLSEILPIMKDLASQYGLRLNRTTEFNLVKLLLINLYYQTEIIIE